MNPTTKTLASLLYIDLLGKKANSNTMILHGLQRLGMAPAEYEQAQTLGQIAGALGGGVLGEAGGAAAGGTGGYALGKIINALRSAPTDPAEQEHRSHLPGSLALGGSILGGTGGALGLGAAGWYAGKSLPDLLLELRGAA